MSLLSLASQPCKLVKDLVESNLLSMALSNLVKVNLENEALTEQQLKVEIQPR